MYSSVWNAVISLALARFGLCIRDRILARSGVVWVTDQNVHLVKHTVGSRQLMGDSHPMRLHEVSQAIRICTNIRYRVALD